MKMFSSIFLFWIAMLLPLIAVTDLKNHFFWPALLLLAITLSSFMISRQLYNYVFYFVALSILIVSTIVVCWISFEIGSGYFNVKGENAYGIIFGAGILYILFLINVVRRYYAHRVYSLEFCYLIFLFLFIITCRVLQNFGILIKSPFT